jgi:hypothetical protein
MANYNEHKCFTCGQIFEYCRHCAVDPVVHKAEGFCSETCADIFSILSKHGCNLATAEETLEALKDYDVTNVTEGIQAHIDSIKSEVEVKAEESEPAPVEEKVAVQEPNATSTVQQSYNKKNKKKW